MSKTLRQLQQQVNEAVEENARRWPEEKRDDLPMVVRIWRKTKSGRLRSRFIGVDSVWIGSMGAGSKKYSMVVEVREPEESQGIGWRQQRHLGQMVAGVMSYPTWYVADLPGHNGTVRALTISNGSKSDWGWTTDRSKAIKLTPYWQRRFLAYYRGLGSAAGSYGVEEVGRG